MVSLQNSLVSLDKKYEEYQLYERIHKKDVGGGGVVKGNGVETSQKEVLTRVPLKEHKPRLNYARFYFLDLQGLDREALIDYYCTWRDLAEYMILQKCSLGEDFSIDRETIAVKCSKRGNDVYLDRVKRKFSFFSTLENKILFDFKNRSKKFHKVNVLFLTLTFNIALCDLQEAWEDRVGREYNSWITNLRRKFGHIEAVRTYEAYSNGYPHVHVVLLFEDVVFNAFKDKKGTWRIQEKEVFEKGWKSFVDVRAIIDLKGGLFYVSKHILKNQLIDYPDEESLEKYLLTLALCWIFRKRSYAVSKGFIDLMNTKHISNFEICSRLSFAEKLVKKKAVWILIGFSTADVLGISSYQWNVALDWSKFNVKWEDSRRFATISRVS